MDATNFSLLILVLFIALVVYFVTARHAENCGKCEAECGEAEVGMGVQMGVARGGMGAGGQMGEDNHYTCFTPLEPGRKELVFKKLPTVLTSNVAVSRLMRGKKGPMV